MEKAREIAARERAKLGMPDEQVRQAELAAFPTEDKKAFLTSDRFHDQVWQVSQKDPYAIPKDVPWLLAVAETGNPWTYKGSKPYSQAVNEKEDEIKGQSNEIIMKGLVQLVSDTEKAPDYLKNGIRKIAATYAAGSFRNKPDMDAMRRMGQDEFMETLKFIPDKRDFR